MENKVDIKNLCPMIAMISAGKTSLLNIIYNVDFLEINSGIGTKFVNIIRYNKNVGKKPIFYHLILKNIGNGNYEFYKDPKTVIVGKENIKKAIADINQKLREEEHCKYEELFYMIEIGETNLIKDEEYLKNYDLVDIPGVSEFRRPEKNNLNEDKIEKPENHEESFLEDMLLKDEDAAIAAFVEGEPIVPNMEQGKESKTDSEHESKIESNKETKKEDNYLIKRSLSVEKKMLNYNPENEQNYLTEIFKIIKNKMNNGIIVFSLDNYQLQENYDIIGKLKVIIKKPIENFLVILNKIDKSENREKDIRTLKEKIIENFPNGDFNFTKNIIVPCSAIQLENEIKMENNFFNLIYFHFINYLMKNKKENSSTQTTTPFSFIEYSLPRIIRGKVSKKTFLEKIKKIVDDKDFEKCIKDIKDTIEKISNNHKDELINIGVRTDEFEKEDIQKIIDDLNENNEEENQEEDENEGDFNIQQQEANALFLFYYSEFKYSKKKVIPPKGQSTKEMINYFTMKNMNINREEEIKKIEKQILEKDNKDKSFNDKIDEISEKMKVFYKEFEDSNIKQEKLPMLRQNINSSIGILKASKLIYIPILGVSNAGKSTIFNGLIGDRLLPTQQNECTKKGILIKYSNIDVPVIRKVNFVPDKLGKEEIYYFKAADKIMGKGIEQIRDILEGANGKFVEDEEDFFYEIDIRIQYIHENKYMDNNLKEKICFIDLPGFGTGSGNKFETQGTYELLMKSSSMFLFVVKNLTIKENNNQEMLNRVYKKMVSFRGITSQSFVSKCLFIINCEQKQEISPKTIMQAKKDIIEMVNSLNKCSPDDINVSFFNAKIFENYVFKSKYYLNPEMIFRYHLSEFEKSESNFFNGVIDIVVGKNFNKFLIGKLKQNVDQDFKNPKFDEKKVKIDEDIKKIVMLFVQYNSLSFNQKELDLIIKYISFGKEFIKYSDLLNISNSNVFKNDLRSFIEICKKTMEKEINLDLKKCFNILDDLFEIDPLQKVGNLRDPPKIEIIPPKVEEDLITFDKQIQELLVKINNDFIENNVMTVLNNCEEDITKSLKEQKENIEASLEKQNSKKIKENFEQTFKDKTKNLKEQLYDVIENASKNVQEHYTKCYELINKFYANSILPEELLFKNFLSTKLGRENDIELTIEEMVNDILASSRDVTRWKNRKSFWEGLKTKFYNKYYLNKIIDCMIDKSTSKIKEFIANTSKYVEEFKTNINNEINTKTLTVRNILNEMKKKEEMDIKDKEEKNEKEQKLWEEEKRLYEEKVRKWEETCNKYKELRYEITSMRLFEN